MFRLDLEGLPQFAQQLQRLAAIAQEAMTQAMQEEADRILEATYPDVPVLTGALISSGTVLAQPGGADIRFGNFGAVPYAAIVHEDTTNNHPRGGTHHYLSRNLYEATADMSTRLAADLAPKLRS